MVAVVLVKWHIIKGQEPQFKEHWEVKMNEFKSDGLFREILSEVNDNIPEKFKIWQDLHSSEYSTFINVGIWESLESFDEAIKPFMPKVNDFEYKPKPRERYVLTYVSDREGEFPLPKAKIKAKNTDVP